MSKKRRKKRRKKKVSWGAAITVGVLHGGLRWASTDMKKFGPKIAQAPNLVVSAGQAGTTALLVRHYWKKTWFLTVLGSILASGVWGVIGHAYTRALPEVPEGTAIPYFPQDHVPAAQAYS